MHPVRHALFDRHQRHAHRWSLALGLSPASGHWRHCAVRGMMMRDSVTTSSAAVAKFDLFTVLNQPNRSHRDEPILIPLMLEPELLLVPPLQCNGAAI